MKRFFATIPWGRALVLLAIAACAIVVVPGNLGLWRFYPLTQALAMQGLAWLGIAALSGLALVVASRRSGDRWMRFGAGLAVLLVVLEAGRLLWGGATSTQAGRADRPHDLAVVSINVGDASGAEVAAAVEPLEADVIVLIEADAAMVAEVGAVIGDGTWQTFTNEARAERVVDAMGILVDPGLGDYGATLTPDLTLGGLTLDPRGHDGPVLAAVHTYPPIPGLNPASRWRAEVRAAVAVCEDSGGIVAGDFNATGRQVERSGLESCANATGVLGLGHRGTWPASWPAVLGSPIDHQLFDETSLRAVSGAIVDVENSDHRAIVVRYRHR